MLFCSFVSARPPSCMLTGTRRIEMRKEALEKMPKMIEEWKRRGHGRGWKDWPSGKAKF